MDHSCDPDCFGQYNGPTMIMRALKNDLEAKSPKEVLQIEYTKLSIWISYLVYTVFLLHLFIVYILNHGHVQSTSHISTSYIATFAYIDTSGQSQSAI
jgi:hypothetical protein